MADPANVSSAEVIKDSIKYKIGGAVRNLDTIERMMLALLAIRKIGKVVDKSKGTTEIIRKLSLDFF